VCFESNLFRLLLSMHKCLTAGTGGSHGHGHGEVNRVVHIGRYSMRVSGMSQGGDVEFYKWGGIKVLNMKGYIIMK